MMSMLKEEIIEIIDCICSGKIIGRGGASYNMLKRMEADSYEIKKLDDRLEQILKIELDAQNKDQEELVEQIAAIKMELNEITEKKFRLMGFVGYKYTYEISLPIWQSTMDYFKIITAGVNYHAELRNKTDEIVDIIEFINNSQEDIIVALERDRLEGLKGFRPSKVSSVLFDYSTDKPEFSFYVESNEEYHYHVYIREDKSFDAKYIS